MRLDRLISVNLVHTLRQVVDGRTTRPRSRCSAVPVLMYHSISDAPETDVIAYYRLNTAPAVFCEQMSFLSENGYRCLTLSGLTELLRVGSHLPPKSVVITFDDGFRSFLTEAHPILKKHGFTATVFLATGFIHQERRTFERRECLTWSEVRALRECAVDFGSHTVNHPKLSALPWTEVQFEVRESKRHIERHLNQAVTAFCFPFGFPETQIGFCDRFAALLRDNGYTCCATTRVGRVRSGDNAFALARLPINSLDDRGLFQAKLDGDYDWLASPQRFTKRIKQLISS